MYEGEIKKEGDTVFIRTVPDITVRKGVKGGELTMEFPAGSKDELNIDQFAYFYFACDDIDAYQSDMRLMDLWSDDAGQQMKILIDGEILADIYSDVHADNKGASAGGGVFDMGATTVPETITKANVLEYIVDAGTLLDMKDRPMSNRWGVIPPWMAGMIKKSDLKDASLAGDGRPSLLLRPGTGNGRLGITRIGDFELFMSNQVPTVTDTVLCYYVMFGHKSALTFASQMEKMETVRLEKFFGDAIRGKNVYGWKVIHSESMVLLYCRK